MSLLLDLYWDKVFPKKRIKHEKAYFLKTMKKKFEKALFSEIMEKKIRVEKKNWEIFFPKIMEKKRFKKVHFLKLWKRLANVLNK